MNQIKVLLVGNNGYQEFARSVIAGCSLVLFNIIVLYIFTELLLLHYLLSSSISFGLGLVLNFVLQKYWVFRKYATPDLGQFLLYVALVLFNYFANVLLLYVLTEYFNWWYILSQLFTTTILAIFNFVIGKKVIFQQ